MPSEHLTELAKRLTQHDIDAIDRTLGASKTAHEELQSLLFAGALTRDALIPDIAEAMHSVRSCVHALEKREDLFEFGGHVGLHNLSCMAHVAGLIKRVDAFTLPEDESLTEQTVDEMLLILREIDQYLRAVRKIVMQVLDGTAKPFTHEYHVESTSYGRKVEQRFHYRHGIRSDMDHVMNIMLTVDPNRSEQTAFSMVARRNTALRVIEVNDKIIGYTVMQLERLRVIIKEHCVDPKWRGKGIGSGALEAFKYTIPHQAGEKHYTTMTVSEENLRAQKLLAEVGFVALKTVLAEEEGVPDSLMFGLLKQ